MKEWEEVDEKLEVEVLVMVVAVLAGVELDVFEVSRISSGGIESKT